MTTSKQFCTFYLEKYFFGVPVEQVQEVIRYLEMTHVPLVSDVVRGLINLRGQIVTAIDLRRRLGMKDRAAHELPMNVVVRTDDGAVSLLVDDIGDVIEVAHETYEAPPKNMPAQHKDLIEGVYKLDGQLLLVLNTSRALSMEAA
ncbi:MAG TPA: chemotaxis protein CheW [Terriglobales bacterium]|nr:chemotaxis protein CheW [Terriglobales bacterium]